MDEVRRYELYIVLQPQLDDEQLEKRIERLDGFLTGSGGEIIEIERKGKRRLAYPIQKFDHGIDLIYQANLPASALETLERQFNLFEDVIRYLTVRRDDLEEAERLVASEEEIQAAVADLEAQPVDVVVTEAEPETLELAAQREAEAAEGAVAAAVSAVSDAAGEVAGTVSGAVESAVESATGVAATVAGTVEGALESAADAVAGLADDATAAADEVTEDVVETADEAADDAVDTVAEVADDVEDVADEATDDVADTVAEVADDVEDVADEAADDVEDLVDDESDEE